MVMFSFYVLGWKLPFWGKLGQKSRLSVEAEILYLYQLEYAKFNHDIHFFCFRPVVPFLGKFGPKN